MNNSLLKFLFIVLAVFTLPLNAAENEILQKLKTDSKEAFNFFDKSKFMSIVGLCERINSAGINDPDALYYSAYSKYRLVNIGMTKNIKSIFETYFQSAIDETSELAIDSYYSSEAKVVQASVYMMKLAKDQSEAPAISAKIYTLLGQAESQKADNPRIYLVKGVMLLNTPEQFGGSIEGALEEFKTALHYFDLQDENEKVTWGKYETLAWCGIAHQKKGDVHEAKKIYTGILENEPDFGWVKYDLLPALENTSSLNDNENKPAADLTALTINITGFENNSGLVRVALSNSLESYDSGNAVRKTKSEIKNNTAEIIFRDLPPGEYAVSCFHDENGNELLDRGTFGNPTEAYGFSNNARGSFGPPSFEESKFLLNESNLEITINVE